MKAFQLPTLIALLLTTTAAETIIAKNPDGTIKSIQDVPAVLQKRDCTHNNCLRAMIARPSQATDFCRSFTTAVVTASAAVSPFTQCAKGVEQASSACSCFVPVSFLFPLLLNLKYKFRLKYAPSVTSCSHPAARASLLLSKVDEMVTDNQSSQAPTPPPCNPPGGHCTINTFIQDCCHRADGSVGCYFPTGDPNNGECFLP